MSNSVRDLSAFLPEMLFDGYLPSRRIDSPLQKDRTKGPVRVENEIGGTLWTV